MDELKPVYLIYGDDFQRERAVSRLKSRFAESGESLDVKEFTAALDEPAMVLQAAETLPFFGQMNLVVVRDFDKASSPDQKMYVKYAENPSPNTCLVLVADKIRKGSVVAKTVDKNGQVYEFKMFKQADLLDWIYQEFHQRKKKVDPSAVRYLIEQAGTDQRLLESEIEKISVYMGEKEIISREDLEPIVNRNPQNTIFELIDCLGQKKKDQALRILNRLIRNGEPPLKVLSMIVRQFRMILKTKALEANRSLVTEFVKELRIPPFIVKKYRQQGARFSMDEIKKIFRLLHKTDLAIKKGELKPDIALEILIGKMFS